MLVTDRRATGGRGLVEVVIAAVEGGVDAVQVREKDLPDEELLDLVTCVQAGVAGRAAVLVNGRASVARETGAGLHLPADAHAPEERFLLLGRSVHSAQEALLCAEERLLYLLTGHVFETESKLGLPGRGLRLVRDTVDAAGALPVLAIGGIDDHNAGAVIGAGAGGVAVRGAILSAGEPEEAARAIRGAVDCALKRAGGAR